MKKVVLGFVTLIVAGVFTLGIVATSTGCAHLPDGWEDSASDDIGTISSILRGVLSGEIDVDDEKKMCIVACGVVGGVDFWKTRETDQDVSQRLLHAVKEADGHAKDYYPALYDQYGGLDGIVLSVILDAVDDDSRQWIEVRLNESEILLSLLHAVIDNGMSGNLVDLSAADLPKLQEELRLCDSLGSVEVGSA